MTNLRDDDKREVAWRQLAQDLFTRLNECQPLRLGPVTALPKLPADEELRVFAARFRALSEAGGWTRTRLSKLTARRRWWWPFGGAL
jgi:hypothetical protein